MTEIWTEILRNEDLQRICTAAATKNEQSHEQPDSGAAKLDKEIKVSFCFFGKQILSTYCTIRNINKNPNKN